MANPVRPVPLQDPQARQAWTNKDGTPTPYFHRYTHSVFMRLGGYEDSVWRSLGVGFTGLTQINQVSQRVADVERATAAVQGAVAGLRGDPRLDDGVEALALAITALVQVQARASGETEKRLGDLAALTGSLGARLTKATAAIQIQQNALKADARAGQQFQTSVIQRSNTLQLDLADEIDAIDAEFETRARAALSGSSGIDYTSGTGAFSLNVEFSQDLVGAMFANGGGLTWTYNDPAGTISAAVSLASFSTSNLAEGSNLYYTNARADARIAAAVGVTVQAYDADLTTWATITPGAGVGAALAAAVGSAGAFITFNGAGGTPSSLALTNATGLPVSTGISGLATGVATFLGAPSSLNLRAAITDETGTGALVFATSPTLVAPALGTPASGVLTNATGLPLTTGVTGTLPVANGGTGTTTSTGSGSVVLSASPVFTGTTVAASLIVSGSVATDNNANLTNSNALGFGPYTSGGGGASRYMFSVNSYTGVNALQVDPSGYLLITSTTTASAANLYQAASGTNILRSTSSRRYKRDIETVRADYADKVLDLRPVWYRSKAEADDPAHGFWGLIAEEVAEVDPRLVHFAYREREYRRVKIADAQKAVVKKGSLISPARPAQYERRLKDGAVKVPDGVQYERICVLLLDVVRRQGERIAALERAA